MHTPGPHTPGFQNDGSYAYVPTVNHTPGPWVQPMRHDPQAGCNIPCGAIEAQGTGIIVASVLDMTLPEWAANARLIAAAPELLEALEFLTGYVEMKLREGDQGAPREHVKMARAAIAKAKGA